MRSFFHKWAFALIYLTLMAACSPAPILTPTLTPSPMPVRTGALTPYTLPAPAEPTPSRTPDAATPLPVPSITPTPLTYTVRASDDMGGIAYRFGVTVADLIAANPKVNPRAMSVGTVLIIPATGHAPAAAATAENATPTALPIGLSGPDCWPTAEGGLWCFALVTNPLASAAENLLLRFRVAGSAGEPIERDASGLLNLLPAGKRMPVGVFFPNPAPVPLRASVELLNAYPILETDARYAPAQLAKVNVQIAADGLSAQVSGQVELTAGNADRAQTVWIASAALDDGGKVVGMRRWENILPLESGTPQVFQLTVYSLGGKILTLETLAEARR